jgi:hypothetical protein
LTIWAHPEKDEVDVCVTQVAAAAMESSGRKQRQVAATAISDQGQRSGPAAGFRGQLSEGGMMWRLLNR